MLYNFFSVSTKKRAAPSTGSGSGSILQFCKRVRRTERDILANNLRDMGLRVRYDPPGDGSCFFHAVLDQIDRLQLPLRIPHSTNKRTRAMNLRKEVLKYFANLVSVFFFSFFHLTLCFLL